MPVSKKPHPQQKPRDETEIETKAKNFMSGAEQSLETKEESEPNKKPIMIRIDPAMIKRIDQAAKRLGISRSAFIVSSAAERLERME